MSQKRKPPVRRAAAQAWSSPLAECRVRAVPLDDFYPSTNAPVPKNVARACAACPVRQQCLDAALAEEGNRSGRYGIRGGLTPVQRRLLNRRLAAAERAAELNADGAVA